MDIKAICASLRKASYILATQDSFKKNSALAAVATYIDKERKVILEANALDLDMARSQGMSSALQERLELDDKKIDGMLEGIQNIRAATDPIGKVVAGWRQEKGLKIEEVRVPIGVVALIYESRPNVTADAFALSYKSGNAVLLRGSASSLKSNIALYTAIVKGLKASGGIAEALYLARPKLGEHEDVEAILKAKGLIDVVLPRGSRKLIDSVTAKAAIPVIQTGAGVCHLYVDDTANIDMALDIALNAKASRPGACNALECLVVHKDIAASFLTRLSALFSTYSKGPIELRGDEEACKYMPKAIRAKAEDFDREYLDLILAVKTVSSIEEAIDFINAHGTGHSEAIVTSSLSNASMFHARIDAACVYVNASTRFTDGGQFGFGAEWGISTQKLHTRGPMGLEALTTTKYLITGDGQIRE